MNRPKLMAEVMLRQTTLRKIAEAIGVAPNTMSLKVNGHRQFDAREIRLIAEYLQITDPAKVVEIFIFD